MAKSLDQVAVEREVAANEGAAVSSDDLEIAVLMTQDMLAKGGMKVIKDAINQSKEPALVIGQFLGQMVGQLGEKLMQEFPEFDMKVFLAKGGWLDQILDYIEGELGYPEEFSDQIYAEVMEMIKAAASTPPAPNNVMEQGQGAMPEQPMPPQPPAPGAMPQAGGRV